MLYIIVYAFRNINICQYQIKVYICKMRVIINAFEMLKLLALFM